MKKCKRFFEKTRILFVNLFKKGNFCCFFAFNKGILSVFGDKSIKKLNGFLKFGKLGYFCRIIVWSVTRIILVAGHLRQIE